MMALSEKNEAGLHRHRLRPCLLSPLKSLTGDLAQVLRALPVQRKIRFRGPPEEVIPVVPGADAQSAQNVIFPPICHHLGSV
jgi:hypothetical protein